MGEISMCTSPCSPFNQSVSIILRQYLMTVETKECNDSMIWSKIKRKAKKKLASNPGIEGKGENTFSRVTTMCEALC